MTTDNLNEFQLGYIECALWTETYENESGATYNMDENFEVEDIDQKTIEQMVSDCNHFYEENVRDIIWACENKDVAYNRGLAGHDFWLTRNGHGAGFWDRGLGEVGRRLTASAKIYKGVDLYVGDDDKIYAG